MKKIKIYLLSLFAMLCNLSINAQWSESDYDFEVNGICYQIKTDKPLQVSVVKGKNAYKGDIVIPATVQHDNKIYEVTTVGEFAFYGCEEVTSVDLGNVEVLEAHAFESCRGLSSMNFKNVKEIGWSTFGNCSGLNSIDLANVNTIGSQAFQECVGLTSVDLKNVIHLIGETFYNCSSLTSVDLGILENIPSTTFKNCSALTEIDLKNVKKIDSNAFQGCTSLTKVDLKNVDNIETDAFFNCSNVKEIWTSETTPPVITETSSSFMSGAFDYGTPGIATLYVPFGSLNNYINATYWNSFVNIEEIPSSPDNVILSIQSDGNGHVECGDDSFTGIKSFEFPKGSKVTLKFVSDEGSELRYFTVDGENALSSVKDNTFTIEMKENTKVRLYFDIIMHNMSLSCGKGGYVSCMFGGITDGVANYDVYNGENVVLSFYPNNQYMLGSLKINGIDVTNDVADLSYSFVMNEDKNVEVDFYKIPDCFITIKQTDGGDVTFMADYGKTYRFVVNVSEGWKVNTVIFNDTDVTSQLDSDNAYLSPAIKENSILNVSFELENNAVSELLANKISVRGHNGLISVEGSESGDSVNVYNADGNLVSAKLSEGNEIYFNVPLNDVYIVKVGNRTFKLAM